MVANVVLVWKQDPRADLNGGHIRNEFLVLLIDDHLFSGVSGVPGVSSGVDDCVRNERALAVFNRNIQRTGQQIVAQTENRE